ncbi:MAG: hypothetical protein AAFR21_14420 [Pseudomonadota bacterium]
MMKPNRQIMTRLVAGVIGVVFSLGLVLAILQPERIWAVLAAIVFLPLAIVLLTAWCRRKGEGFADRHAGKLRAGIAGAGVVISAALLIGVLEQTGVINPDRTGSGWIRILVLLPGTIAVTSELFSDWLSKKAEKPQD